MNTAANALPIWGLEGAKITLIAVRENAVYRVEHGQNRFALRLHRQGYRTDSELAAELDWMAMLDRAGLSVPSPIASLEGTYLHSVDGMQVDVLTWLEGETLDAALPQMDAAQREKVFHQLGHDMARMHSAIDAWPQAISCDRPAWDQGGLLGHAPLWDRFWDNPALNLDQKTRLLAFRDSARDDLTQIAPSLDYGLIHADLVAANVMVSGDTLHVIDFDDGGFGFRLFDVATALLKHRTARDYPALRAALLAGYTSLRPLDTPHLPLFMALRAASYVGWNISRADEDDTGARNARFITQAEAQITEYTARL
ncbi:phosphotransferase [Pseudooctadecabacter jejudonensis]|uniref:Homoserine kinase n=1 Tax=Pseudooctadecabacter jejudonensis TaxID=1391910 RepID=A0A1Y5R6D4_9RHOB|nr:phosphotransferase [Pseudooctadecabacter jejudonensis]SLN10252.1 Homoserine kinase [Pseudooctadecabacter jejudonensis]